MRIALLDFHRIMSNKIEETFKIMNVLKDSGVNEVEIFQMLRNIPPEVNLDRFDGFVIGGSDSSRIEKYRGYKRSSEIVDSLRGSSMPVLGICAGNQMLAGVFNLEIDFMESPEMGWYEIELTDQGKEDSLFCEMPEKFISFQCHIKHIVLRNKMKFPVLAKNKNCIQAIRYCENIWGIQFHPEDSIEEGNVLINKYIRRAPSKLSAVLTPQNLIGRRIFKNFIKIVKKFSCK